MNLQAETESDRDPKTLAGELRDSGVQVQGLGFRVGLVHASVFGMETLGGTGV